VYLFTDKFLDLKANKTKSNGLFLFIGFYMFNFCCSLQSFQVGHVFMRYKLKKIDVS
jgi:hypothetical protein